MKTQVKHIGQILRLVLYQVSRNIAQQAAAAAFAAAGLLVISHAALHKWMKKLGPYLAELVAEMVAGSHAVFASERSAAYHRILDLRDAAPEPEPATPGRLRVRRSTLSSRRRHRAEDRPGGVAPPRRSPAFLPGDTGMSSNGSGACYPRCSSRHALARPR
ncbi:MAG: hypothetical protein MUF54_00260 [Polyangiaceae bacterium]|nr:hypothetical protein [Polyangiaceae bacterium]